MQWNSSFDSCLQWTGCSAIADGCPATTGVYDGIWRAFTASVGAGPWLLFPACGMGLRLRHIAVQEDNHQKVLAGAVRRVYFRPVRAQNSVGNGELFTSDRRWSGVVILFGPGWWRFSARSQLLFQALLLAHGGLTTLAQTECRWR